MGVTPPLHFAQVVLHRLWAVNPHLLLEALIELYAQDANNLPRVLDICQELRVSEKSNHSLLTCRGAYYLSLVASGVGRVVSLVGCDQT
jgi:hypothetical protein